MPCDQLMLTVACSTHYQAHNNIYIWTVNSIMVVIAVSPFTSLRLTELLVSFCSGKSFPAISIHAIVKTTWSSKVHLTSIVLLAAIGLLVTFSLFRGVYLGSFSVLPDYIDMAGAVHGLRQTKIRKHTTQTGALLLHYRRALHQAGYIWRRALERQQNIQSIGLELGPLNVLQMLGLCIVATLQPIVKKE